MDAHLISVGRVAPDPAWQLSEHAHSFCELIVPISGRIEVDIDGRHLSAERGDVLLYPAGISHSERSDRSHPVSTLFIAFSWNCPSGVALQVHDRDGRIRQAVSWLQSDRDLPESPELHEQRERTLAMILAAYVANGRQGGDRDELVRSVRSYIRDHLTDPVTLDDLANVAGLSRFHFIRRYTRLAGRKPIEDVRAMRMERARELLLSTDLPLKQIAPLCGLSSEYALSRAFSRRFGHPPRSLRQ